MHGLGGDGFGSGELLNTSDLFDDQNLASS